MYIYIYTKDLQRYNKNFKSLSTGSWSCTRAIWTGSIAVTSRHIQDFQNPSSRQQMAKASFRTTNTIRGG